MRTRVYLTPLELQPLGSLIAGVGGVRMKAMFFTRPLCGVCCPVLVPLVYLSGLPAQRGASPLPDQQRYHGLLD